MVVSTALETANPLLSDALVDVFNVSADLRPEPTTDGGGDPVARRKRHVGNDEIGGKLNKGCYYGGYSLRC